MPELNTPNRCATQHTGNRRSIDFGDERGLAFREEVFNACRVATRERARSEKWRLSDNNQQRHPMSHDRIAFVRLVSNALIVS